MVSYHDTVLSVYKNKGTLLYPFTCARAVGAAPTAALSRAGEGTEEKPKHKMPKTTPRPRTQRSREVEQVPPAKPLLGGSLSSPGKTLAGEACPNTNRSSRP